MMANKASWNFCYRKIDQVFFRLETSPDTYEPINLRYKGYAFYPCGLLFNS